MGEDRHIESVTSYRLLEHYSGEVARALQGICAPTRQDALERRSSWPALEATLPAAGIGGEAVLDELVSSVVPNGSRLHEEGFWGFITAAPGALAAVTSFAASIASPQRYTITAFNALEEVSLDWLGQLCALPGHMKGVYSSGGSAANLVALGAARQWAYEQHGVDPAADGLGGRVGAIYTSTEAHHTVQRAAAVLGIGRRNVRVLPADQAQRLDIATLNRALAADRRAGIIPVAVVATAGTTNTGAIDPLRAAGEAARDAGAWFHVDGAYGLPGVLDERIATRYDGLELADSAIVDPHKWLGAPVGIAATFVRDRAILHRAFTQEPADYLEGSFAPAGDLRSSLDQMGVPYADFGLELSAPARGVVVWAILRALGRQGVRARIVQDNDLARHLTALAAAHPRLEPLSAPELSIACVRYRREGVADLNRLNAALLRRLIHETAFLPSSTLVGGRFAIRPCFINGRTRGEQVDGLADAMVRLGDELSDAWPASPH
ncbi:MAG: aminotransferase class V-fold PLP-dependent enzyme [Actinomycetota bacterium]|nr:aminotransferase class V-fold PLP-dependent enzyme [Actinomycetota bacterium]